MSERIWDCVVVGAGPAGSVTALELARRGLDVVLVERSRFPRSKVCGCCVNPRAVAALRRLGLEELVGRGVGLREWRVASGGRSAVVRRGLGVSLSREALDLGLVEAAVGAGVRLEEGVRAVVAGGDPVRVELEGAEGRREERARRVVVATGLVEAGGGVGRWHIRGGSRIGAGAWVENAPRGYEPGRVEMACGEGGYVGAVVLEDGRLDLAAALDPEVVRRAGGVGRAVAGILEKAGLPEIPGVDRLGWRGTPRLTRRVDRVAEGRVYRVGDAAGYVEPFTGEGIAWAIEGARVLAPIVARGLRERGFDAEGAWERAYRREIGSRQVICRQVAAVLRRARLARVGVGVLGRMPVLAELVMGRLHTVPGA
ncbi:MAG: hypothetical protein KatS3mg108_3077 [Isosphaeraceae bacterium]|jgi:flavin-dependent dehydrogenase|nr:MAG: hypothetical protein KatS3mg108_3077 [Isosphaeraceae bacterium]